MKLNVEKNKFQKSLILSFRVKLTENQIERLKWLEWKEFGNHVQAKIGCMQLNIFGAEAIIDIADET